MISKEIQLVKEKAEEAKQVLKEKAEEAKQVVKEKAEEAKKVVKETVDDYDINIRDRFNDAQKKAKEKAEEMEKNFTQKVDALLNSDKVGTFRTDIKKFMTFEIIGDVHGKNLKDKIGEIADKHKLIGWCNFNRKGNLDGEAYGFEKGLYSLQHWISDIKNPAQSQ